MCLYAVKAEVQYFMRIYDYVRGRQFCQCKLRMRTRKLMASVGRRARWCPRLRTSHRCTVRSGLTNGHAGMFFWVFLSTSGNEMTTCRQLGGSWWCIIPGSICHCLNGTVGLPRTVLEHGRCRERWQGKGLSTSTRHNSPGRWWRRHEALWGEEAETNVRRECGTESLQHRRLDKSLLQYIDLFISLVIMEVY